ncbi:MAG: hypothetical protein H6999_07645 [Hahellaceae bacterium]|nr:hypothetical protein [Hahellaceae bacterium]
MRDRRSGALYLENRFTLDAFTSDRLDVIHLLLAQATISFDNARMFSEVHELNQSLERKVEQRTAELNNTVKSLEMANDELNAFSYSVSHDLRAPLRGINNFSKILVEDYASELDESGTDLLQRIIRGGLKMQELIEGLLELSRVQRSDLHKAPVDLSAMVNELFEEMRQRFPEQQVHTTIVPDCHVFGDPRMLNSAMENLINNAWKYSANTPNPVVEFGFWRVDTPAAIPPGIGLVPEHLEAGTPVYYLKDNGAGFNMAHASRLFGSFQRMHSDKQFSGTGIGLATVKRIFEKHGGYVWACAQPDEGATFYFTL